MIFHLAKISVDKAMACHLCRGIRSAAGKGYIFPVFHGQRGHPVGFIGRFRKAWLALQGDEGARHLLREHQEVLELIECTAYRIIRDFDHPGDFPEN